MPRRDDTVARLMAEALAGLVSQRSVLRRASALGVSGPLVGALLAAQSRTSSALAQPTGPAVPPYVSSRSSTSSRNSTPPA